MSKIKQTRLELEKQLSDQFDLLKALADVYDSGNHVVAKSMATTVRVLVHDTEKSHSLLVQLGIKNKNFFDTSSSTQEINPEITRLGSFCGLVGKSRG